MFTTGNGTRYVRSEYGVSLNLSVNWSQISATHVVHSVYFYREPSGKEPNAPLSLAQVQAERLLPVLGNTNIQEVLQRLHEICRMNAL
jgi:hypothetical protein